MNNKEMINEFANKFIVVEGNKLIFKSDYGEFEKWISELLSQQKQEFKKLVGQALTNCHDCGVKPGEIHEEGCDVERCSVCGGQRLQCGCEGYDSYYAKWTGIWPGAAEADYLGVDLNEFSRRFSQIFFKK